jgi:hypothetical protein
MPTTPFALEITAGNLAGGEVFFLVVHGEGEEVLPLFRGFDTDGGGEDRGLAIGHHDRAVCLPGDPPGFDGERTTRPLDRFFLNIEHIVFRTDVVADQRRRPSFSISAV